MTTSTLTDLQQDFRGTLILPTDAHYEVARKVYNGMIDRRPAIIARCEGVDDVKRAIRFGRDANLLVAVRGGGHGVAGHSTCDGGLVIDLSSMKGIRVDPAVIRLIVVPGTGKQDPRKSPSRAERSTSPLPLSSPGITRDPG